MEDIKWLFRKYGIVILILQFVASPYPPFGEVVDYRYNEGGSFRYLSNCVEEKELELPPIARMKG